MRLKKLGLNYTQEKTIFNLGLIVSIVLEYMGVQSTSHWGGLKFIEENHGVHQKFLKKV